MFFSINHMFIFSINNIIFFCLFFRVYSSSVYETRSLTFSVIQSFPVWSIIAKNTFSVFTSSLLSAVLDARRRLARFRQLRLRRLVRMPPLMLRLLRRLLVLLRRRREAEVASAEHGGGWVGEEEEGDCQGEGQVSHLLIHSPAFTRH